MIVCRLLSTMMKSSNLCCRWTYFHICCYSYLIEFCPLWLHHLIFSSTTSLQDCCSLNEIFSSFTLIFFYFSFLSNTQLRLIKLQQHRLKFQQSFQHYYFFIHNESLLPQIHLHILHILLLLKPIAYSHQLS